MLIGLFYVHIIISWSDPVWWTKLAIRQFFDCTLNTRTRNRKELSRRREAARHSKSWKFCCHSKGHSRSFEIMACVSSYHYSIVSMSLSGGHALFSCVSFVWSGWHLCQKRPRHSCTHSSVAASTTATVYCTASVTVCWRSFKWYRIWRHVLWPVPGSLTT